MPARGQPQEHGAERLRVPHSHHVTIGPLSHMSHSECRWCRRPPHQPPKVGRTACSHRLSWDCTLWQADREIKPCCTVRHASRRPPVGIWVLLHLHDASHADVQLPGQQRWRPLLHFIRLPLCTEPKDATAWSFALVVAFRVACAGIQISMQLDSSSRCRCAAASTSLGAWPQAWPTTRWPLRLMSSSWYGAIWRATERF